MGQLEEAKQKLWSTRIVVNLNLHEQVFDTPMIDSLLASKRIYNIFEIAHAGMAKNPSRVRLRTILEFKLYGGTNDIQHIFSSMSNTEHPNYGIFDYMNNPIGISMLGYYGWYRFVLKKDARDRATFCAGDSMNVNADQVFLFEDIDAILVSPTREDGKYWFEHILKETVPIDERNGNTSFIEAQVLGGVSLKKRDVTNLYYPETDQFNKPFFEKLNQLQEFSVELNPY